MNDQQQPQAVKSLRCPNCGDAVNFGDRECEYCHTQLVIDYTVLFGTEKYEPEGRDKRVDVLVLQMLRDAAKKGAIEITTAFDDDLNIYVRSHEYDELLLTGEFGPDSDGDYGFYMSDDYEPVYLNWAEKTDESGGRIYHLFTLSESLDVYLDGEAALQEALMDEWVNILLEPGIPPEPEELMSAEQKKRARNRWLALGMLPIIIGAFAVQVALAYTESTAHLITGVILFVLGLLIIAYGLITYRDQNGQEESI